MVLFSEHGWLFVKLHCFKETSQICVCILWVGPRKESVRKKATPSDDANKLQCLIRSAQVVSQIPITREGGANLVTLRSGDSPDVSCAPQSREIKGVLR